MPINHLLRKCTELFSPPPNLTFKKAVTFFCIHYLLFSIPQVFLISSLLSIVFISSGKNLIFEDGIPNNYLLYLFFTIIVFIAILSILLLFIIVNCILQAFLSLLSGFFLWLLSKHPKGKDSLSRELSIYLFNDGIYCRLCYLLINVIMIGYLLFPSQFPLSAITTRLFLFPAVILSMIYYSHIIRKSLLQGFLGITIMLIVNLLRFYLLSYLVLNF
jgi:hypothetical protein